MSGNVRAEKKLNRRQEAALVALLTEPTQLAAAARARVADKTLRRWLRQPEFQAAYRELRRRAVDGAVGKLEQAVSAAVEALRRGLTCGAPVAEIRAARTVLAQAARWTELIDLTERIEELERLTGTAP